MVRLSPNASQDGLDGLYQAGDARTFLKARVRARPEDGKANKALVALLADQLGIAKSRISLASGHTAKQKVMRIDCTGDEKDRLGALLTRLAH
ncbi:MAG: DUF167 family protein [Rhizobiaceae bacterium]